jgi:hypothetical protein
MLGLVKQVLAVVMVLASCSRESGPLPRPHGDVEPVPAPQVAATDAISASASASQQATDPPPSTTMNEAKHGERITLRGRPSSVIHQHMMTSVPGKTLAYLDLRAGAEQTVIYWKEIPKCSGDVQVTGKVIELRGPKQRPGQLPSKVDETYSERQLDVDTARCLDVAP